MLFIFFDNLSSKEFDLESDYDMGFLMDLFNKVIEKKKELKLSSEKFILATSNFKIKDFKKEIKKGEYSIYVK